MTDFQKAKVGFALALLGVVFAINPIIDDFTSYGFELLSINWTVGRAYTAFGALLAGAVYVFAVDFAIDRPMPWVRKIGNLLYVLALIVLPAYGLLAFGYLLVEAATRALEFDAARNVLQSIAGVLVGFLAATGVQVLRSRLANSERSSVAAEYDKQEASYIEHASQLREAGYWDMAVLEAFRAIEIALRAVYLRSGQEPTSRTTPSSLIRWAIERGILPPNAKGRVDELRVARNQIAHGHADISSDHADWLLREARTLLSEIRRIEEIDIEEESEPGPAQ